MNRRPSPRIALYLLLLLFPPTPPLRAADSPDPERCAGELEACIDHLREVYSRHGALLLGIHIVRYDRGMRPVEPRAFLRRVVPGGPADRAGIREGDRLLAINGQRLDGPEDLETVLEGIGGFAIGEEVTYTVARPDGEKDITMTLAPPPETIVNSRIYHDLLHHFGLETAERFASSHELFSPPWQMKRQPGERGGSTADRMAPADP